MLYEWITGTLSPDAALWIGALVAFVLTFFLMWKPLPGLPRDGGKKVETPDGKIVVVNDKSSGKITGIGVVFVPVFLLVSLFFLPLTSELMIYMALMLAMMLTGFLDDAAKVPWGELLKGILDLVLAIATVVTFLCYHTSDIIIFGQVIHIPVVLYGILGVALVWFSINVTNCSDGVDGLCGSVTVVILVAYFGFFNEIMPAYTRMGIYLAATLVGYLCFNWNPSKVLMGDAGSRTIGFFLALLAMQSGHPFIFLLMSLVFIFDGGIGLFKLTMLRVFKWNPLKNVLTPFHDHMRKRMNIPIKAIPIIFGVLQVIFCLIGGLIAK